MSFHTASCLLFLVGSVLVQSQTSVAVTTVEPWFSDVPVPDTPHQYLNWAGEYTKSIFTSFSETVKFFHGFDSLYTVKYFRDLSDGFQVSENAVKSLRKVYTSHPDRRTWVSLEHKIGLVIGELDKAKDACLSLALIGQDGRLKEERWDAFIKILLGMGGTDTPHPDPFPIIKGNDAVPTIHRNDLMRVIRILFRNYGPVEGLELPVTSESSVVRK